MTKYSHLLSPLNGWFHGETELLYSGIFPNFSRSSNWSSFLYHAVALASIQLLYAVHDVDCIRIHLFSKELFVFAEYVA